MSDAGIIVQSNYAWACPMLLVKKKNNDPNKLLRLALDLRLPNVIIVPSSHPLPKMPILLSSLSKYKYISTLDMLSAYWQIDAAKEIHDKLLFTTPWGGFTYHNLVFGLHTRASTFQQLVDSLIQLSGKESCFAYQDDIVIGANNFSEMMEKLGKLIDFFHQS